MNHASLSGRPTDESGFGESLHLVKPWMNHFKATSSRSESLTCGTAGRGSWGWSSTRCTWWSGWRCPYILYRCFHTPVGEDHGGQTLFSASHWVCGGPCWADPRGPSTRLERGLRSVAAGSDGAPSGAAPWRRRRLRPVSASNRASSSSSVLHTARSGVHHPAETNIIHVY